MSRPTDDDLEDASEIGRCGCLIPELEDALEDGYEGAEDDE